MYMYVYQSNGITCSSLQSMLLSCDDGGGLKLCLYIYIYIYIYIYVYIHTYTYSAYRSYDKTYPSLQSMLLTFEMIVDG